MSVADLIADQLTVIRNAVRSDKDTVIIKKSGMLERIAGIMKKEGFINEYQVIDDRKQGKIKIYLKKVEGGKPAIENIRRVSTPGRRHYVASGEVRPVMGGVGIAIISTNKGLLTDEEARQQGVGGEVICQVW